MIAKITTAGGDIVDYVEAIRVSIEGREKIFGHMTIFYTHTAEKIVIKCKNGTKIENTSVMKDAVVGIVGEEASYLVTGD